METVLLIFVAVWLVGIPVMLWIGRAFRHSRGYWIWVSIFWWFFIIILLMRRNEK